MFKTEDLKKKALEAIDKNKLIFIEEVVSYLPCSKFTFYSHFPVDSNDYKEIFDAITNVRTTVKTSMRGKWYKSNQPSLQMGLYKLLATKEEQRALSMQTIDFDIPEDMEININIKKGE